MAGQSLSQGKHSRKSLRLLLHQASGRALDLSLRARRASNLGAPRIGSKVRNPCLPKRLNSTEQTGGAGQGRVVVGNDSVFVSLGNPAYLDGRHRRAARNSVHAKSLATANGVA